MKNQCPICNSENTKIRDREIGVYECLKCTHVFTVITGNPLTPYTEEYYNNKHKNWFEHPDVRLFRKIVKQLDLENNQGKSLIDVGCGKGDFLKYVKNTGLKIQLYGIDPTKNVYDGIYFIQGDFMNIDFPDRKDFVVSTMVVEHVTEPNLFMRKIVDILKPNGVLVLNTINSGALIHYLARFLKIFGVRVVFDRLYDHHHLQHYTKKSLSQLVIQNGFEITSHTIHNFPLKAVDLPENRAIIRQIYLAGVAIIFAFSNVFGGGLSQTIVCRKHT